MRQPIELSITCRWPLVCTVRNREGEGTMTLDRQVWEIAFLAISLEFVLWCTEPNAVENAR
jgi:hypothetical protein